MPLDWFNKAGSSQSVADLVAMKKYPKALEKLRAEFATGNRSVGLRLQYADVLEKSGESELAIPILLGLASELLAAGAEGRAQELLAEAERLGPGHADVAARRRSFAAASRRENEPAQEAPPVMLSALLPAIAATSADGDVGLEGDSLGRVDDETHLAGVDLGPVEDAGGFPEAGRGERAPVDNDAVDIFGPALAPPSLCTPATCVAESDDVSASAHATVASEVWVDAEGEVAPEVIVAELVSEPSIADVAEMAVADGQASKGSLVLYIRELAAQVGPEVGEHPGPLHLAAALFASLPEDELRDLLPGLARRDFDPGAAMVEDGQRGDSLFILVRGRARVFVTAAHGRSFEIAELSAGAFFGENSMVSGRRTARVMALGPCETLEVAGAAIEALAPARPLVQQILEDTLLERASSTEVEAVRAVPRMHEATPARALALFDVHFGLPAWNPKMRVRLADLLARVGHYQDVVPVLVGLADEMQAAGQPARALAMLGKIVSLGVRSCGELEVAPLPLEPVAPRPGPPGAILTYVVQGRPAPPAQASQEFRGWLQELMGEARGEEPVQADAAADGEEEEDAAAVEELAAALAAEPEAPAEPARAAIPAGARQ